MYRNQIKIALRYLLRNKTFSFINIMGLAVGMAAFFVIMQYVHFELSYDKFHKNVKDIYRVTLEWGKNTMAANHPATGAALKADFPEVVEYTRAAPLSLFTKSITLTSIDAQGNRKSFNEDGIYLVDSTFLTFFTFPVIYGNPENVFPNQNSIVITGSLAEKFFGKGNPIGKELMINGLQPLMVSAVIKDIPENSHIKFNVLARLSLGDYDTSWEWPEYFTYVRLVPGTDRQKVESKLQAFSEKYMGDNIKKYNSNMTMHLQPLADIYLKSSNLDKESETRGNARTVYFLMVIGILILVIAWINYINLSTSKSIERAREVGLRKISGATKFQVIKQFLLESFMVNLISLAVAFLILYFSLPYFNQLTGKNMGNSITDLSLFAEPLFWVILAGIIILGSFLAGGYPAIVVASFKSTWILKGKLLRSGKGILMRQLLVGFQFAISIGLIAGTLVVFHQVSYMKNTDLGYQKDQLMIIKTPSVVDSTVLNKNTVFKNDLLREHTINHMTMVSDIPGKLVPLVNGVRIKGEDFQENVNCYFISVKQDYIETMGLKLIAGRTFRENESSNPYEADVNPVMLNELAVSRMGFKNHAEIINKLITYKFGPIERTGEVIGVINNYHQRSLKDNYDALIFYSTPFYDSHYYVINVNPSDIRQTVKNVEEEFNAIFPGNPFEYFFLDDYFNKQYSADQQFGKVFGMFSIIAIIVACLGLYGLATFMIAQRIKEIAIRKVLGASVPGMIMLLSKDFIKLILLANLVALPVIYFYARSWLNNFTFHIHIDWTMFILPTVLLLVVSFVATSSQTIKTAFVNPSRTLKYE